MIRSATSPSPTFWRDSAQVTGGSPWHMLSHWAPVVGITPRQKEGSSL